MTPVVDPSRTLSEEDVEDVRICWNLPDAWPYEKANWRPGAWLVNTERTGGPFGVGTRRPIGFTRAMTPWS